MHEPLTYKFQFRTGTVSTVLAYGYQQTLTTVLPPGEQVFEIEVIDSFSAARESTTITFQVIVFEFSSCVLVPIAKSYLACIL